MSRRTRQSSPHRSHRSWPAVRLKARSYGPAWGRRSVPRCRPCAAPWPSPAHTLRSPPSRLCPHYACGARQPAGGDPVRCSGRSAAMRTCECTHPPCPSPRRCRRQRDHLVPSSTPFLARFGLEALATVRVEEDYRSCPSLLYRLYRLWGVTGSVPATGGWLEPPVRTFWQILRTQGTLRPIVTKRGAGCDGRGQCRLTSDVAADGEVVWSWRPDAGAKRVEHV